MSLIYMVTLWYSTYFIRVKQSTSIHVGTHLSARVFMFSKSRGGKLVTEQHTYMYFAIHVV